MQPSAPILAPAHTPDNLASKAEGPALCVDLDGTLVKSDTLYDSLMQLLRTRPLDVFQLPGWVVGGKAALKSKIGERVAIDVAHLPYNRAVLKFVEEQRGQGRKIWLATGADSTLAHRVAAHLGLFEGVLASDGRTNLTGKNKLAGFEQQFGDGGFDYIGNARADIPVLAHSRLAMVANPDKALVDAIRSGKLVAAQRFDDHTPGSSVMVRALRVHQWAKNVLVFLPLLLAHALSPARIAAAVLLFFCFSLCASATYLVNDLLDMEADRRHPRKRLRPFAAGDLPVVRGVLMAAALLVVSFVLAGALLNRGTVLWLLLYLVVTLSYSLYLKRIVLVDVIVLSGLYTVRLLAGAEADQVAMSPWLASFSVFLFLSLAMVKRFAEMQNLHAAGKTPSNGRGYLTSDMEQLRSFGTSAAYASIVVFSFYISSLSGLELYLHAVRLWLAVPLLIFWLSRVWLLASRGELDEDPVVFAVTDKASLAVGALVASVALAAYF